jgi:hypothetical protein
MASLCPTFLLLRSCYRTIIFHYSSLKNALAIGQFSHSDTIKNPTYFFKYNAHQLRLYLSFNPSSNPPSSPSSDLASSRYYIPNICFLGLPRADGWGRLPFLLHHIPRALANTSGNLISRVKSLFLQV